MQILRYVHRLFTITVTQNPVYGMKEILEYLLGNHKYLLLRNHEIVDFQP